MARPTQHFALFRAGQRLATSIVTLAYWRWRQQWLLLAVTGIGMIAAVMVVCIVPLLSEVTLTAGVRDILTASPGNAEMMLRATTFGLSTAGVHGVFQAVNAPFRQNLHPYLQGLPRFELQTLNFPLQVDYRLRHSTAFRGNNDCWPPHSYGGFTGELSGFARYIHIGTVLTNCPGCPQAIRRIYPTAYRKQLGEYGAILSPNVGLQRCAIISCCSFIPLSASTGKL